MVKLNNVTAKDAIENHVENVLEIIMPQLEINIDSVSLRRLRYSDADTLKLQEETQGHIPEERQDGWPGPQHLRRADAYGEGNAREATGLRAVTEALTTD
eukprot:756199-Hanusia_phi.AAC.4